MTVTITKKFFSGDIVRGAEQGIVELIGLINLGASYATGGIAVDFSDVHPDCANASLIFSTFGASSDASNYGFWDAANNKLLLYVRSTDAELANATDVSAAAKSIPFRLVFRASTAVSETFTQ